MELPTLTGQWDITQIDSCYLGYSSGSMHKRGSLEGKGSIVFNNDSTGFFIDHVMLLTCGETDFNWDYNKISNKIEFGFENGDSSCSVITFRNDTVEFYMKRYCEPISWGVSRFYYVKLVRTE